MQWWQPVGKSYALDTAWLKAHPLPDHSKGVDKNSRGRVLIIGGSRRVPGGILLTAEAAFRAGAGKVSLATIGSASLAVGVAAPDCAVVGLPETPNGEISRASVSLLAPEIDNCDAIILGPAMTDTEETSALLDILLPALPQDLFLLLDASALRAASDHPARIAARGHRVVLTPHEGELAAMLGKNKDDISADPMAALKAAAQKFASTVMIKGATTHLISDATCLSYAGGGSGLAVSGSGDVLAGIIGGLAAQGLAPLAATAWGIWLHGQAGLSLADTVGPIGYLARELPPLIPQLMRGT